MASEKAPDTFQKARLHRADARVHSPCGSDPVSSFGGSPVLSAVGARGTCAPRMVKATGSISAKTRAAPANMVVVKLVAPVRKTRAGTITMPPKLAPFSARLMARPRFLSNQSPKMLLMAPRLMVAQANAITR